ncbi:MAG: alpha/beta hydrolase [Bacteroidales bacterium]|nr:alpha/beta hydrolase [Bacteroidales bacterium]
MQSLKSKIILGLLIHSHYFRFRLKKPPFDSSIEGILKYRKKTEKAAGMFGKLPEGIIIKPEVQVGGRYAEWVSLPENPSSKVILWFHGGFYMIGSPQSHRVHVSKFVKGSGLNALVFDYRLAPEHPFPAALDDALSAYSFLIASGFQARDIVFAGDSAGGGLCLATLLVLKEKGMALPAAAAVLSPWTDLRLTGQSHQTNKRRCFSPEGCAESASGYYAGNHDKADPQISPLYGDLSGLPPLHISAGSHETLLDDAVRFAGKAEEAGTDVTLIVGEGMCHCYPVFGSLFRESEQALSEICLFLGRHAGKEEQQIS